MQHVSRASEEVDALSRILGSGRRFLLARQQRFALDFRAPLLCDIAQYGGEHRLAIELDLGDRSLCGKQLARASSSPALPPLSHLLRLHVRVPELIEMDVVHRTSGFRKKDVERLAQNLRRGIPEHAL